VLEYGQVMCMSTGKLCTEACVQWPLGSRLLDCVHDKQNCSPHDSLMFVTRFQFLFAH